MAIPRRRPQAVAPFATPVDLDDEVLASIPRAYVLTKQDRSLVPPLQRRMIREHPCERVIEIDADHAPFFSATDELVAALLRARARRIGRVAESYDVIVVGSGSGGAVVARRLVDAGASVCVIEAGGVDENPAIHDPAGSGSSGALPTTGRTRPFPSPAATAGSWTSRAARCSAGRAA